MKNEITNTSAVKGRSGRKKADPFEELYPMAFVLKRNIELLCRVRGTLKSEMALVIGCSDWKLRERMRCPWDFNMGELTRLAKLWDMTPDQLFRPYKLVEDGDGGEFLQRCGEKKK